MEKYVIKNQKRLRCGITTGTCGAAAANAAATFLLLGIKKANAVIHTPKGITVEVPVQHIAAEEDKATCMVVKDSGDDPDVTNQAEIYVTVEKCAIAEENKSASQYWFRDERFPGLSLDGGVGIGRVTGEGLEQAVGQAAINVVPREMIFKAVYEVCNLAEYQGELLITVSIPAGLELSKKTFNPRLGIEGGLSVLGTSGILEPMSEQAIVDTIEAEIKQCCNQGKRELLIAPGNYGQAYISKYLGLDMNRSIKCSNYIGDTLDFAVSYGMERLLLVGNIGKLVKLAAGIMNTHSKVADGRMEILAIHTVLVGGTQEMAEQIMKCINTEQVLTYLVEWGLKDQVIESICSKIYRHVRQRVGDKITFGVMLFSENYGYLGETEGSKELVKYFGI